MKFVQAEGVRRKSYKCSVKGQNRNFWVNAPSILTIASGSRQVHLNSWAWEAGGSASLRSFKHAPNDSRKKWS